MEVFDDVGELASALEIESSCGPKIVAIEGASSSGKTYLAKQLSSLIKAPAISTDPYYRTGFKGARYTDGLRLDELMQDIKRLLRTRQSLIIEGLCLRDTLDAVSLVPDAFVYCKKLSAAGLWHDDPERQEMPPADSESVQALVDRWSLTYHLRTQAHERATFVFLRDGDAL